MNKLFIAASAATLLAATGSMPSLAQSSSSGAGAATMPSITCRDLSGMDQQTARNVVFYLGGLHAASAGSTAMNSTTGTPGSTTGSSATTADAGSSGTTADTSDSTGSTTQAGSSGASGTVMAQLPGFSMINADQILSTCQSSPDKQLSEVLGTGASAQ